MKEILQDLGVDYETLLRRFSGNEAILRKFILKFPKDQTFPALQKQVEASAYQEIERSAHTLKGLSANLGFAQLSVYCADLVACVRGGDKEQTEALFDKVREEYERIVKGLSGLC